jgi:hypothetical protein
MYSYISRPLNKVNKVRKTIERKGERNMEFPTSITGCNRILVRRYSKNQVLRLLMLFY